MSWFSGSTRCRLAFTQRDDHQVGVLPAPGQPAGGATQGCQIPDMALVAALRRRFGLVSAPVGGQLALGCRVPVGSAHLFQPGACLWEQAVQHAVSRPTVT